MRRMQPLWQIVIATMMVVGMRLGESGRMNTYGRQAMAHWRRHLPAAYRQIPDPEAFFTRAGEEMQTQVTELSTRLAGPDLPGEGYLEKVARLTRAKTEAEQIVRTDSGMFPEPEPTRQEWEQTSPQEDALIDWAWQMQAQLEGLADTQLSLEQAAKEWILPGGFLAQMATSSSPWEFWKTHPRQWETSVQARWERHLNQYRTDR
ncbi:MAG TPA: hypothetical protein PK781_01570 [Terrimesophilobacter sp.]|nr:hypothetical protein [Terrimesophilobacter sp.]